MKNDYYVYGHYLCENGRLFYVGKGRRNRLNISSGRSKQWNTLVSNSDWCAKIIKNNLTSAEALELETQLIKSEPALINVKTKTETNLFSEDYLSNFYYDESSPSCLRWAKEIIGVNGRIYKRIGDVAGRVRSGNDRNTKRWQVAAAVGHKAAYGHRVVYALFNKIAPDLVVDHIDGNSLNNKIANLRQVSQEFNTRNVSIYNTSNSSGITGVSIRNKRGYFSCVAYYRRPSDGNLVTKTFSFIKYGKEEALRLAQEWRNERIAELNLQGAGYTDRHGT